MSQSTYSKNDTWCQITKKKKKKQRRRNKTQYTSKSRSGIVLGLAVMELTFPTSAHTVLCSVHPTNGLSVAEQCWHSIKAASKTPQS